MGNVRSVRRFLAGVAAGLPLVVSAAAPAKPNVLLIVSDDHGYGDFGFTGNRLVQTPALARLSSEAAVFKNFVAAAACSPTVAALWTGRDHLLTGVWGVGARAGLRPDEVRMPAFFKAAGYSTFHAGKLDSVKVGRDGPPAFGWEEWMGGGGYEHRDPMIYSSSGSGREKGWFAEIMTDRAVAFIRAHRGQPWFASVSFIIPLMPWVWDEKYSAPFLALGCSASLAACYGCGSQMDACIGRLLDALRETGQADSTVVAFFSDNGQTGPEAKQAGADGIVRGPDWEKRNVAGLRGHKATVWENGIRVPFLVRWPVRVPPGERAAFGCVEDVLPTLLELAGVGAEALPHQPFTGVSLAAARKDPAAAPEHPAALRMAIAGAGAPGGGDSGPRKQSYGDLHLALRGPRFKYHALPQGEGALYDLAADPGETTDVRARQPEVAARMAAECRARWEAVLASGRAFAKPADGAKSKGKGAEE
jgi:arylsulfatase A